jgi:subtilase family serine protease
MKLRGRWLGIIASSMLLVSSGITGLWAQESGPPPGWVGTPPIHYKPIAGMQASVAGPPYTPSQIKTAYGFSSLPAGNTGAGQTIAIIVAYGSSTIVADLAAFSQQYGLPAANLQIYYPTGQPNASNSTWALETSLDVEWAHALAPGATIQLVVAKDNSSTNLFAAVRYATNTLGAHVVSMSWGGSEWSGETAFDSTYFTKPGTIFVAASGDNGSGALYPAASPKVVAVGGTSLFLNSDGTVSSETAWSGSGGGPSAYETVPSYQTQFGLSPSGRGAPEVSLIADPNTGVNVYSNGGWYHVGGTSLSTPCWAAIMALVNQGRGTPLTDGHQAVYGLAGTQARFNPSGCYRDITQGNDGGFTAGLGYDLVTGLGVPIANKIIPALRGNGGMSAILLLLMDN